MTKRLFSGVLLSAVAIFAFALTANAERLTPKEWVDKSDPYRNLPLFFRASAGTTWVQVNSTGGCDPAEIGAGGDIHDGTDMTSSQVWCFEGPDSLWPAGAGNSLQDDWSHYSRNLPPLPQGSRWHATTLNGGTSGGAFNAWVGCDINEVGSPAACADVAFWDATNGPPNGYGDEWEQSLIANVENSGAASGGTLTFDVRYDVECVYDYLYVEYFDNGAGTWNFMLDALGTAAVFNGVSNGGAGGPGGNTIVTFSNTCDNGSGGAGDGNYHDVGTQVSGNQHHGNSTWYTAVSFPIPSQTALKIRWRGSSDPAWSDADGRGDTDGIGAIDNVSIVFNNGDSFSDDFEFGDFNNPTVTGPAASWETAVGGNTYDGWHLEFDPMYKNKGNTCTFSDDWMWAAKPAGSSIPENGFEFFLTSPVIPSDGWTGGTALFSQYQCMPEGRSDYTNTHLRVYDTTKSQWSPWSDFDGFISFAGCEFWNTLAAEDLTPFLGAAIDSIQMGWEVLDVSQETEVSWGNHGAVQYLVDNVAFGSFDGSATVFTTRGIDIFADTFSRADPAHTPFLQNAEQGLWTGIGGTRPFVQADSLNVSITDSDGMNGGATNVTINWRVEEGWGAGFGGWASKAMNFSQQDATRPPGEGLYATAIGADDGGAEDYTGAVDGLVWETGTTVEYYILVTDQLGNNAYFPAGADPVNSPDETYFEFSVLPFNISTAGNVSTTKDANGAPTDPSGPAGTHFVLLVDDYTRNALDFENSTGFVATGGVGQGSFDTPVLDQPEDMTERALALLYGGSEETPHWDKYDVQGAGSSVQCEPRGVSDVANGLGAYVTDAATGAVPYYDALIWLQGTFDGYSYADTTRLELANYLDKGGCLFSTGDQVAFHLGTAGNDADSLIGFAVEYFGVAFPNSADEMTGDRVLNAVGQGSMAGMTLGVYGECPIRRTFDRLTLSNPTGATNSVLMTYQDSSDPADNGRPAAIKNVRTVGGGTAAHFGFGIEALLSDVSRARVLGAFLGTDCGLTVNAVAGANNGVDAPVIANGFGFNLAAARPNPFRDATSIQFAVPNTQHVTIEVYNILGQKVRTLVNEKMEANSYVRDWDGRSDAGAEVSSGIYFYKMVAGEFSATKKAVLLK